jgi:uncharacterized SAM-binding protein YcdF (DUF218 family)
LSRHILLGLVLVAALVLIGARPLALWLARPLVRSDPPRRVDAIAVFGAGIYDETTLTPESAYRLLYAAQLLRDGHASVLILAGGGHRGARGSDAEVMARVAHALGIEASSLLLDGRPSSTAEQAASVAALAARGGIRTVAVVTSPLKSYRTARALQRTGLNVISTPGIPAGSARPLLIAEDHLGRRLGLILETLYEHAVIAAYWWRGLI